MTTAKLKVKLSNWFLHNLKGTLSIDFYLYSLKQGEIILKYEYLYIIWKGN